MKHLNALKKAIVAGVLIGIGCTVYLNMDNSIAASFLFGLGLFTIINLELNLFTGKIGYLGKNNYMPVPKPSRYVATMPHYSKVW